MHVLLSVSRVSLPQQASTPLPPCLICKMCVMILASRCLEGDTVAGCSRLKHTSWKEGGKDRDGEGGMRVWELARLRTPPWVL